MATNAAKVNIATSQALQAGASPRDLEIARQYMGRKDYIGYCQKFVGQVTGGRTRGASAIDAWNKAPQKVQGVQGLQKGDVVYFSPNASNRNYGHTGIYAGNGQFISATNSGIRQTNLLDWIKSTGQKLLGYVPGTDRSVGVGGQQGSQSLLSANVANTPQKSILDSLKMRQIGLNTPIPTPPVQEIPKVNLTPNQPVNQGTNISQYA